MDAQQRFDDIVGLIYDTAYQGLDPSVIVDSISSELESLGETIAADEDSQRQQLLAFVSQWGDIEAPVGTRDNHAPLLPLSNRNPISVPSGSCADHLLRRLGPHLMRSAGLRQRLRDLEMQRAMRDSEIALLPFGMVWIAAGLHILSTNPRADDLLRSGDALRSEDRRLIAWFDADNLRLQQALRAALDPVARQSRLMAVRRSDQKPPLVVSVFPTSSPQRDGPEAAGRVALAILQNAGDASINLEHLQAIYGFTAAERRLAEALLANETLESFADKAHVSRHTARSHLAHLFAKTGTSRQAELVRLLMLAQPRS